MAAVLRALIVVMALAGSAQGGPVFDAARTGDLASVERLLDGGSDVDERGRNDETPLIAAALAGQTEIAALLIARGADVMARNKGGLTALHAAAYAGSTEVVRLLLDHGAAIEDNQNFSGATPLIVAAEEDRVETAEFLLARGADPMAIDGDGFSVLTQAWAKQRIEMVRLLKRHGATCQPVALLGTEDYYRSCVEAGQ